MFKTILKTVKQEKTKSTISDQSDINQIPSIPKQIDNTPQFFNSIQDYKKFQILNTIDTIYYIRNILTQEQQDYLLDEIYLQQRWNELPHSKRRVQKYGGDVENTGLKNIEPLPNFLKQLSALTFLDNKNILINHVLINEYSPGVGIQQHFDGPLYYPFVNIFSLNSNCIFKFTQNNQTIKLFIEPGSLLIFSKDAYTQWLHGIDYYESDTILLFVNEGKVIKSDLINIEISEIDRLIKNKENEYCPLIGNNQYNAALIIKRKKRISITMRNVYA